MAKDIDVNAAPPSADQMRMALLEEQMAEAEKQEKLQAQSQSGTHEVHRQFPEGPGERR